MCGADTESVQLPDRYEPQCFTFSAPDGDELIYIPERENALKQFLTYISDEFFDTASELKHMIIYFHNLEYDWLQLVKNDETLLEMSKVGVGLEHDKELYTFPTEPKTKVILKKHAIFSGSAPHIKFRIMRGRRSFTLYLFDTFSFFPSSLSKLAKDLKLPIDKMERQEDLGQVDFRQPNIDKEETHYFETYAKLDARVTRLAGEQIRDLHRHASMTKIRPSAPSFAINLLLHGMSEEDTLVTGVYDEHIMQLIFDTYRGGRTGGIYHGQVDNLSVFDFHSSYPASMLSLPSFNQNMAYVPLDNLELENIIPILEETGNAFLRVSGIEHDPFYPSLITTHNNKLTPIYGAFENVATTGYELLVGIKSGSLEVTEIHEAVILIDMDENPFLPFREFALSSYEEKQNSDKGSTIYTSAKLKLNAAYGKLIESRTQKLIGASDSIAYLPYLEGMEKDFGNYYYQKYIDLVDDGKTLKDGYDAILDELLESFDEETCEIFKHKMFGDFTISGRVYGRYVLPAAASLITACSRARLCAAMKSLSALYWDTDSVFVQNLSIDEANQKLTEASAWLPQNAVPLKIGEALGEMDAEIEGASGYLAGVKRYYLEDEEWKREDFDEEGKRKGNCKSAIHGIPALPREKRKDVIQFLATGRDFSYTTKPRPLKARESKSSAEIGSFKQKLIKSAFHLDERLRWTNIGDGWSGSLKPFKEMDDVDLDEDVYQKHLDALYQSIDTIKQHVKQHGYIKTMTQGDFYYREYKDLSRSIKQKYFRKNGLPIDVWCDATQMTPDDLLNYLLGES